MDSCVGKKTEEVYREYKVNQSIQDYEEIQKKTGRANLIVSAIIFFAIVGIFLFLR
jgi:hypothetical protein